MPTTFLCPHCEAKLQSANPQIEGKRVRCAKCNSTFTVTAGLIVRDAPVRVAKHDTPENSSEPSTKSASKRSKKAKKHKRSSSTVIYWARNLIALALLIGIVTATVIILINKGWINVGE